MNTKTVRNLFIIYNLLFVSAFCIAQQNLPSRIVGRIPANDSRDIYQIQVGAFSSMRNAVGIFDMLKNNGFNPIYENFMDLTRVIIPEIPANEVTSNLERLKRLGIDSVIIRQDLSVPAVQPEIIPERQIVIIDTAPVPVLQEENIPDTQFTEENVFLLNEITALEEPESKSILLSKTWRVVSRPSGLRAGDGVRTEETIGRIYQYLTDGTYKVMNTDGTEAYTSHWRWVENSPDEFMFSHDNWRTSWKTRITVMNENSLIFNEGSNSSVEFAPAY